MENNKKIGYWDYTVILTYLGFASAFIGMVNVLNGKYEMSLLCLMVSGICDMFDGAVASTKKRNSFEKGFGIQIDSLCDLTSFGILPALFVVRITGFDTLTVFVACVFGLFGLVRLAYYNVQEAYRQSISAEKREKFLGVPITTSAVVIPFVYLLCCHFQIIDAYPYIIALALLGIGYITPIEVKKPALVGKIIMCAIGLSEFILVLRCAGIF